MKRASAQIRLRDESAMRLVTAPMVHERLTVPASSALASIVIVGIGVWAAALAHDTAQPGAATWSVVLVFVAVAPTVLVVVNIGHRGLGPTAFAPARIPMLYLSWVMTFPVLYPQMTGKSIGSLNSDIATGENMAICALVVASLWLGMFAARSLNRSRPRSVPVYGPIRTQAWFEALALCGRTFLVLALFSRALRISTGNTLSDGAYGSNQLSFTGASSLTVLSDILLISGTAIVTHASFIIHRKLPRAPDLLLIALSAGISLVALGSRNELIPPLVLIAWYAAKNSGGIRLTRVAVGLIAVAFTFAAIVDFRSGGDPARQEISTIESAIADVSGPTVINASLLERVPSRFEFEKGSTYLDSLMHLLPGPVTRALGWSDYGTAAFKYRDIMGYDNPDMGVGFAFPAEGYLNFGLAGIFASCFLLGYAMRWSYTAAVTRPSHGLNTLAYPLLIAILPYGFRTDMLGLGKTVLYVVICIISAAAVANATAARNVPRTPR